MKLKLDRLFIVLVLLALFTLNSQLSTARAQGTAFTYQGRLSNNGSPANGSYDVTFALFNTNTGGVAIAGPVTNSAVVVSNGLFTTLIDFGNAFNGSSNWLEIGVRTNGNGGFNTLTPRQPVTPTPYAITAQNVAGAITVQNNTNNAPNIIGGSSVNYVLPGVIGATIGGGGGFDPFYGAETNSVTANFGTVGGGSGNIASGDEGATVGGGQFNAASLLDATVSGGHGNTASGNYSTVSGGFGNIASGNISAVLGGQMNNASGLASIAAGVFANAINDFSFVWSDGSTFSSTADHQFSVFASGGVRLDGDVTTGDISLSEPTLASHPGAYHHLQLSGGNSLGFLYGSYPKFQDFITLGYNYYADPNGNAHIPNSGGGSSRVSVGYGEVIVAVGDVNAQPLQTRIDATLAGVSVYGTFNNFSDRNAKQDFAAVSPSQILDQVLQLPVSEWSYKEDAATRHIGPMAQDFYSVFNIGTDEKHIAPIDEGGIAFAAIQGLNQKLENRSQNLESRSEKLEGENAELKARLDKLEKIIEKDQIK